MIRFQLELGLHPVIKLCELPDRVSEVTVGILSPHAVPTDSGFCCHSR